MELIADGLLILAAIAASIYCLVLSRRVRKLNRLDNGLGGAIASLSTQVDEMRSALAEAKQATERSKRELDVRTKRAEQAAGRLEVLLAAVRDTKEGAAVVPDLPDDPAPAAPGDEPTGAAANPDPSEPMATGPAASEPSVPEPAVADPAPAAPIEDDLGDAAMPAEQHDEPYNRPQDGAATAAPGQDASFDEDAPVEAGPAEEDAIAKEESQDDELRLADALSDPSKLGGKAGGGISTDLLKALDKMAGGGS